MADRLFRADLLGARVFWLIDFVWAGVTWRIADEELDVLTEDGDSLHYAGGLGVLSVEEGLDFLSDASGSAASASLAMMLPLPPGVTVGQMVRQGHDLAGARGEVSRWVEGTPYESRRVLVSGIASDPEFGGPGEPVNLSIEAAPWLDSAIIPPSDQAVIGDNWDDDMILSLSEGEIGLYYPIVIGRPGKVSEAISSTGRTTGSQGVYVDHRGTTENVVPTFNLGDITLVIAGHHVTAASVHANTNDYVDASYRFYVRNGQDRDGHPIAYLSWWATIADGLDPFDSDFGAHAADYTWAEDPTGAMVSSLGHSGLEPSFQPGDGDAPSGTFIVWVDDDDASAGGLADPATGQTMRNAGAVLGYLLGRSGAPIDRGRFEAARPLLDGFNLDFCIDAQCTPWQYVRTHLLPILPVSIVSGPSGLVPIVWRYDAKPAEAQLVLDLVSDVTIERASNVSYDRSNLVNDITLNYALSYRTKSYGGSLRYAAEGTSGATPDYWCTLSARRYGVVVAQTIDSPCVYDDATAHAVLGWMTRAYALARRRVEYIVPEALYGWAERGMVVRLTDPDIGMEDQVCMLESMVTDGSPMLRLKLLIVEDPIRDYRGP